MKLFPRQDFGKAGGLADEGKYRYALVTAFTIVLIDRLLKHGRVETESLSHELAAAYGVDFDPVAYAEACKNVECLALNSF